MKLTGIFTLEVYRNGKKIIEEKSRNLITREGLLYLARTGFITDIFPVDFYLGLKGSDVDISYEDKAQTCLGLNGTYREITDYVILEDNYRRFGIKFEMSQNGNHIQLIGTRANIYNNYIKPTNNFTLYGMFITSEYIKNSSQGILFSASNLSTPIHATPNDILNVEYKIDIILEGGYNEFTGYY